MFRLVFFARPPGGNPLQNSLFALGYCLPPCTSFLFFPLTPFPLSCFPPPVAFQNLNKLFHPTLCWALGFHSTFFSIEHYIERMKYMQHSSPKKANSAARKLYKKLGSCNKLQNYRDELKEIIQTTTPESNSL